MTDIIFVITGITAGIGLLATSIITTYCCFKRYGRNQSITDSPSLKQQQQDCLNAVIINQHIAKHLRPNSAISFISDNYHNDMTLIAPIRRLAMLEQQQRRQEAPTLVIESSLKTQSNNSKEQNPALLPSFIYENLALELGELQTTGST